MMDHILELDWCATTADTRPYLVSKKALDNCCIEKILSNKFYDPLISSDEEDNTPNNINWDNIFKSKNMDKSYQQHVPGLRPVAPYPKESMLTHVQQNHCLKVISEKSPHVLPGHTIRKPLPHDYRIFESLSELYEKERKEFIDWAKSLWPTSHCSRVLNRDPIIETTYEKEFNLRAKRLTGYPKTYSMAAQIPLETSKKLEYKATKLDTLISVNISELPIAEIPEQLLEYISIMEPCPVPEPCSKHPYQFVLPYEHSVSMLPITEIHRELCKLGADHGTKLVASESALKCLVSFNRHWTIPITVCPAVGVDGVGCNVVVLDSEFSLQKEPAMMRTYKAYRRLLQHAFVPSTEYEKVIQKQNENSNTNKSKESNTSPMVSDEETDLTSDDEAPLIIYEADNYSSSKTKMKNRKRSISGDKQKMNELKVAEADSRDEDTTIPSGIPTVDSGDTIGVYRCTCNKTQYKPPPPRSFCKWRFENGSAVDNIDVIIHCSHKAATEKSEELIMEPIPEYQLEVGACEPTPDSVRCSALALMLRDNATLLTVRVDGCSGEVVRVDREGGAPLQPALGAVHTALVELQALLPGHYLLHHQPNHGANALLYVSRPGGDFNLEFDVTRHIELDQAKVLETPPTIAPLLLPLHKYRKILPCAFTPYLHQVHKTTKKPSPVKPKPTKWHKKKKKKNKTTNKMTKIDKSEL